jgi:outer membrane protein assembly factor BamA
MITDLDSSNIYSDKTYLGGKLVASFDNRNSDIFPTRGVWWFNELISTAGIKNSNNFTSLRSDMTVYASLSDPARIVAVIGIGGGKIFNQDFEFFQAMNIGVGNNLHGFRKNRYTGQSSAYGSLELRMKLFEVKSYFLPGPLGIKGFYDIGRVWLKGEDSKIWHSAYGGGIYFIPFNMFMVSAGVGFAGGERLYNITLGSNVNLNF